MSDEDLSSVDENTETQGSQEENEGIIDKTLEEAEVIEEAEIVENPEILENEELEGSESEELLESDKEKDMKKNKKKLQEENEKLQDDVDAIKDKFLRTTAEYENFRKRTAKEKQGIYTDACADVLKEVLPVLDNLERALSAEGSGEELRTGVEMTVRLFNVAFEKLGVEELASDGEFDPNLHNAVMHVEDEKYGANEIVEVFQKGYKKENKVLRHSMVKVAN
ncbi:nucleotide exchange factor GrpE [Clostridium algoriphilum]|uniref:nucleotide exchange factor GrpE n=1 Tax=Clostridium algoriphilum TaxID=198347 RepID=UPI001CF321E9|nr:nucleotide exchange factor GrpE [Clostridium algoriphilum]MCB2292556.1 nucleotide exchange factor GrpE [Clostridium algoriphilum]